jgi:hypothetical protein
MIHKTQAARIVGVVSGQIPEGVDCHRTVRPVYKYREVPRIVHAKLSALPANVEDVSKQPVTIIGLDHRDAHQLSRYTRQLLHQTRDRV